MTDFFRTVGAFLFYTAAGIIAVLYLSTFDGFIKKWGLPLAILLILIAYFIFKKSPVNTITGKK